MIRAKQQEDEVDLLEEELLKVAPEFVNTKNMSYEDEISFVMGDIENEK